MAKAKPLGPTFQRELDAVGLGNAPVKFRSDGSFDISGLTPEQRALFLEVRAGHDPTKPVSPALAAVPLVTPRLEALEHLVGDGGAADFAQQLAPLAAQVAAVATMTPRLERTEHAAALIEALGPRVEALEKAVANFSSLGAQLAALTANVSALATIQSRRADELSLFQQHDATALRAELTALKNDIEAHFKALKAVLPNVDAPVGRAW